MTTCTVTTTATGEKCAKPAICTFTGRAGETFAECAEHATCVEAHTEGHEVGAKVMVHRYGKAYEATIVKVGARGAAYAEFTYAKGTKRTVRI